jgi:hypothetical protein
MQRPCQLKLFATAVESGDSPSDEWSMDQWGGRARATALSWAHWGGSAVMGKVASVGSLDFFIIFSLKSSTEAGR